MLTLIGVIQLLSIYHFHLVFQSVHDSYTNEHEHNIFLKKKDQIEINRKCYLLFLIIHLITL